VPKNGAVDGMSDQVKYCAVLLLIWAVTMLPAINYFTKRIQSDSAVETYLSEHGLLGLPLTRETAIRVSDQIRKDFNTDVKTFKALNVGTRPYLRDDVAFLLKYREGLCGEGARVLVRLLIDMGFDATRITLYDEHLQPSHTLVSVMLQGKEFLVDSINSTSSDNRILRRYVVSTNGFNVLHYTDNILRRWERESEQSRTKIPEELQSFYDSYWLYSYEAIPATKVLTGLGMNVRIFNFGRPGKWVSTLAERPNTFLMILSLVCSVVITFLAHLLLRHRIFAARSASRRIHGRAG
jgi:hypothetical protein